MNDKVSFVFQTTEYHFFTHGNSSASLVVVGELEVVITVATLVVVAIVVLCVLEVLITVVAVVVVVFDVDLLCRG